MLILAGVSINAVVGDNGILGKATDAVYLQSAAVLGEYFNQLYAEGAIDGNEEGETPLDTIMKNGYQDYFFKTSEGYCLKKPYINTSTGETQTLVLYLVKKEQLPEEIRKQIKGADNLESRDYRKLNGVYGITSDLRAYYCQSGIDSILGLTTSDLNADSPDIIYADENSILAEIINNGTAPVTNQNLKSIKILTLDTAEKVELIKDFSKFTNLKKLFLTDITIDSLNGIEGASNSLEYIKIRNCKITDYSAMSNLTNLKELYIVRPVDKNEEIKRLCSETNGIKNAQLSNLNYFGIIGGEEIGAGTTHDDYLNSISTGYCGVQYGVTDISPLADLNDVTKKAIKYINLQNLQITSLSSLSGFTNVYYLRAEKNALYTLEGIQNMNNLTYLIAPDQYSTTLKKRTFGLNDSTVASNTDALSYIYKENNINSNLYYVDLRSNVIKNVSHISSCNGIEYLYLAGNSLIADANSIQNIVSNCGEHYSIDGKYGVDLLANTASTLSLTGTIALSEFEKLMNSTTLKQLSLNNISINDNGTILSNTTTPSFNEEINKVLSTCKELLNLRLITMNNLTSIDFIGANKVTKLIELDLRGTSVTNLVSLNTYALDLRSLHIDNKNIDITTIQPTISRCTGVYEEDADSVLTFSGTTNYWCGGAGGCNLYNWELISQLPNCTQITYFKTYNSTWASATANKELDLRNTQLKGWWSSWNRAKLYLPSTLEKLEQDGNTIPVLADNLENLTNVSIWKVRELGTEEEWTSFINSLSNANNLEKLIMGVNKNFKFSMLKSLENLEKLEEFEYFVNDGWTYDSNKTSIDGLGSLKYLKKLTITDLKNVKDISDIKTCSQLEEISVTNTQISDISALGNMPNLRKVILSNNQINNIFSLSKCNKIEYLDLKNNALTDFGYYTNDFGKSVGYENIDIFYDLNYQKKGSLKYLDISNNNIKDLEMIEELDWPDGHIGFGEE